MNRGWTPYYPYDNHQANPFMYMTQPPMINYYGSQMDISSQQFENSQTPLSANSNSLNEDVDADGAQTQEESEDCSNTSTTGKGKGPAKAKKTQTYDTMTQEETKLLVNLWVANHERIESKDSRKQWRHIVDELNAHYKKNRTVDKCKRKMKYLVEKYKERKDWNRKQTGGNLWKSPFYDEIDSVLGVRDVVTFQNVEDTSDPSTPEPVPGSSSQEDQDDSQSPTNETGSQKRRERKSRKRPRLRANEEDEEENSKLMKTVADQGDKIADVIVKMQESQAQQMAMMNKFMDSMLKMMESNK